MAPVDLSYVQLETNRLILRPFRQEDLYDFNRYASLDQVGPMAGWAPHQSLEESQTILNLFMEEKSDFAIVQKSDGRVIGSVGIKDAPEQATEYRNLLGYELGYALAPDCWGQGLMPEAIREVIRFCFEDLSCEILFCGHFLRNTQSMRVQEKCGFSYYKTISYATRMGTVELTRLTKLLRDNWESQTNIVDKPHAI